MSIIIVKPIINILLFSIKCYTVFMEMIKLQEKLKACQNFGSHIPEGKKQDFVNHFIKAMQTELFDNNEIYEMLKILPSSAFGIVGQKNFNIASLLISGSNEIVSLNPEQRFEILSKINLNDWYSVPFSNKQINLAMAFVSAHQNSNFSFDKHQTLTLLKPCDFSIKDHLGISLGHHITKNNRHLNITFDEFRNLCNHNPALELELGVFYILNSTSTKMTFLEVNQEINLVGNIEKLKKTISQKIWPYLVSKQSLDQNPILQKIDILIEQHHLQITEPLAKSKMKFL